jgi:DNA repair exonuclease SbcCD ATPase subunit
VRRFPGGYDYYKEKTGKDPQPQELKQAISEKEDAGTPTVSSKELRQARAKERAKWQPRMKELKRNVQRAETKIAALEEELEKLSEVLFNPAPDTDFSKTNQRLRVVQDQLDTYTRQWESDAEELEKIQQEQDSGTSE